MLYLLALLALSLTPAAVLGQGAGALYEPPSRNSMWRFEGFDTPKNWRDLWLNCGGMNHQWNQLDGKCGLCGDPYDQTREHEDGGKYATGQIVRTYSKHNIPVSVQLNSNALGFFEFRVCDAARWEGNVTRECFDRYGPLVITGTTEERYTLEDDTSGAKKFEVTLPGEIPYSDHLILQWRWKTAKSWGCTPNNKCCLGCGQKQEEFYNCADIKLLIN